MVEADAAVRAGRGFPQTSWGLVQAACAERARPARAFAELYRRYRLPIYAALRRQGHAPERAEDLAQDFFLELIEQETVARADAARGRFRSFLLGALQRFLANARDREMAQKRGAGFRFEPLDMAGLEAQLVAEPGAPLDIEFDRDWARTLVSNALAAIAEAQRAGGQEAWFEALRGCLDPAADMPAYAELARRLDSTEGAVKTAVHRLRRQFRDVLRAEVAATLGAADDVDEELRHLRDVLAADAATSAPGVA